MPSYKLTYFDFDGGRGEHVRIALHAAGIDFEDHRISFAEFGDVRESMPFKAVPVLEIDGQQVSQSNAQARYIGRMANLYPTDAKQALYCDEVMDAVEDINHYLVATFGLSGDEMKQAREKLVAGRLTVFIRGFDGLLQRGGGKYFADDKLTVADLKIFVQIQAFTSGQLDHIPTDLVEQLAPSLIEHEARVSADPIVKAYYESRT